MPGLGTIINVALILVGGLLGHFFGKLIKESFQNTLTCTCGISVMFIGIGGALEGMLSVECGIVSSGRGVFIVVILLLGAIVGEIIDIEGWL